MAYTYDDFLKAAEGSGVMDKFSQQDLVTAQKNPEFGLSMLSLQKDLAGATTEEQRLLASEAANQLRKTYGNYTVDAAGNSSFVGNYGSQIQDTMGKMQNFGPFQFSQEDAYKKVQEQLANQQPFSYSKDDAYQKLLQEVTNPQGFSYDPSKDPRMAAYKKMYLREGERATQNTLAQASAGTGGVPSSFAVTAAQQAGNYYAGKLADIIPTLYDSSYSQYLNEQALKQQGLGALQTDRNFENQQYMDQYSILQNLLGNMQADRNFENQQYLNQYNMLQNLLGNLQTQNQSDYNQYLDALNYAYKVQQDQQTQQLQQNQLEADAKQQEFNNAMALYQLLGYMTPEMEQILLGKVQQPVVQEETKSYTPPRNLTTLTDEQIEQLQGVLGLTQDGYWGPVSSAAVNGMSAEEAYNLFVLNGGPEDETGTVYDPSDREPVVLPKPVDQTPSWLNFRTYTLEDQYNTLKRAGATQEELEAFLKENKGRLGENRVKVK